MQARGESDEGCRRVAGCVPWRWARREDQGATAAATSVATPNTGANSRVAPLPSRLGSGHAPGVAERRCIGRSDSPLAGLALAAVGAGAAPLGGAARQLECHVQMPQHAASVLAKLSTSADVASCDARTPRLAHWPGDAGEHSHDRRAARVTRLAWRPQFPQAAAAWRSLAPPTTGRPGTPRPPPAAAAALCSLSPTSACRPARPPCGTPPASAWSPMEAPTGCLTSCHASRGKTQRQSRCAVAIGGGRAQSLLRLEVVCDEARLDTTLTLVLSPVARRGPPICQTS